MISQPVYPVVLLGRNQFKAVYFTVTKSSGFGLRPTWVLFVVYWVGNLMSPDFLLCKIGMTPPSPWNEIFEKHTAHYLAHTRCSVSVREGRGNIVGRPWDKLSAWVSSLPSLYTLDSSTFQMPGKYSVWTKENAIALSKDCYYLQILNGFMFIIKYIKDALSCQHIID